MKCLNCHLPILTISKEGLVIFQSLHTNGNLSKERKKAIITLFERSHLFLQLFCKGNDANQIILNNHKDTLIANAQFDFGQTDLLCEIFRNNRSLCENVPDSFL